jgi:hypothetical protein
LLEPQHDPNDPRGQHLCRFATQLASDHGIDETECIANARSDVFFACRREGASCPTVHVGLKWFDHNAAVRVCTCGHTHRSLVYSQPQATCTWPSCACAPFTDDGVEQEERLMRIAEAIVAHEVGHLLQERERQPTRGRAAQFNADLRAARLVGVDRVIESIVFTDWVSNPPTYDSPSGPERVARLRAAFGP